MLFLRVKGKGSKERIIPINSNSLKYLKLYLEYRPTMLKKEKFRAIILEF